MSHKKAQKAQRKLATDFTDLPPPDYDIRGQADFLLPQGTQKKRIQNTVELKS
jgi:hypothetical protein